jgi:hypothetical protein
VSRTKYLYKGAPQIISLRGKDAKGKDTETDVALRPGEVELDGDSPYTKSLLARGLLVPVPPAGAPGPVQPAQEPPGQEQPVRAAPEQAEQPGQQEQQEQSAGDEPAQGRSGRRGRQ